MIPNGCDLTITSVLADRMIGALMAADRVRRQDFEALLLTQSLALRTAKASRAASILHARAGRNASLDGCPA